jgi:hypothetical protein
MNCPGVLEEAPALERLEPCKAAKCSAEVRERVVRLIQGHAGVHPTQWAAVTSIAEKLSCSPAEYEAQYGRLQAASVVA